MLGAGCPTVVRKMSMRWVMGQREFEDATLSVLNMFEYGVNLCCLRFGEGRRRGGPENEDHAIGGRTLYIYIYMP